MKFLAMIQQNIATTNIPTILGTEKENNAFAALLNLTQR